MAVFASLAITTRDQSQNQLQLYFLHGVAVNDGMVMWGFCKHIRTENVASTISFDALRVTILIDALKQDAFQTKYISDFSTCTFKVVQQ